MNYLYFHLDRYPKSLVADVWLDFTVPFYILEMSPVLIYSIIINSDDSLNHLQFFEEETDALAKCNIQIH